MTEYTTQAEDRISRTIKDGRESVERRMTAIEQKTYHWSAKQWDGSDLAYEFNYYENWIESQTD